MAKTAGSGGAEARSEGRGGFWPALGKAVVEGVVEGSIIKWVIGHAMATVDRKVEDKVGRARNKHYFAAAMVKLRARDAHAADVIDHFNNDWLGSDPARAATDQEDFQHNAAKVGTDENDKMDDTVQFLYDLAQLPTHEERELRITALGFIGPRSVDMAEHAVAYLEAVRQHVADLPQTAGTWFDKRKDELAKLDQTPVVTKMAAHAKTTRSKWEDKLKARKP